jgi:hypothetical protein
LWRRRRAIVRRRSRALLLASGKEQHQCARELPPRYLQRDFL